MARLTLFLILFLALPTLFTSWLTYAAKTTTRNRKLDLVEQCLLSNGISLEQIVLRDSGNDTNAYEDLNFQWNTLYGLLSPAVYMLPDSPGDVSIAVQCCTQTGTRIVPRSGGHSYLKYGFGDSETLVLDLRHMNEVEVIPGGGGTATATIGAGARGGKVQYDLWAAAEAAPDGLALPAGMCPTVGIAGFTLGGGWGYYSRLHGLAIDNLVEVQMVDWTGALLTINRVQNPDLFWALRGGGGGSFGIVTSMRFRVHAAPTAVVLAVVGYNAEDFVAFFKSWQTWISSEPANHLGTFVIFEGDAIYMELFSIQQDNDGGGNGGVDEVERILATWFPTPVSLTVTEFTYPEWMVSRAEMFSGGTPVTQPSDLVNLTRHGKVGWKKVKSIYVEQLIQTDAGIAELHKLVRQYLQWPNLSIGIEQYGGAIKSVGPTETAFIHRNALYEMQLSAFSADGEDPGAVAAMQNFFEATKASTLLDHRRSYQNYLDEDLPDYLERYYGDNLERLVSVKQTWDPHNVFYNPRTIPLSI